MQPTERSEAWKLLLLDFHDQEKKHYVKEVVEMW